MSLGSLEPSSNIALGSRLLCWDALLPVILLLFIPITVQQKRSPSGPYLYRHISPEGASGI